LRERSRTLLADAMAWESFARQATRGELGSLRIGFGIATLSDLLPRAVIAYRRLFPHVLLEMQDMGSRQQLEALLDGTIDLGFIRLPVTDQKLETTVVLKEEMLVAVAASRFSARHVTLRDLRDEPFVLIGRSASTTFHQHALKSVCGSRLYSEFGSRSQGDAYCIESGSRWHGCKPCSIYGTPHASSGSALFSSQNGGGEVGYRNDLAERSTFYRAVLRKAGNHAGSVAHASVRTILMKGFPNVDRRSASRKAVSAQLSSQDTTIAAGMVPDRRSLSIEWRSGMLMPTSLVSSGSARSSSRASCTSTRTSIPRSCAASTSCRASKSVTLATMTRTQSAPHARDWYT
jgi:hypothetical protein